MLRSWMVGGLGGLLLASALWARPGIVKTRDGQTFRGDVSEQDDQIVIDHKGIHTIVPRENLRTLTYADSIDQESRRRLARLTRYDVPGRLELAQWLFENHAYDLARGVLDEAREIQPRNPDVADMIRTVDRQSDLENRENRRHAPVELAAADNSPRGAATPAPAGPRASAAKQLTPEEINIIKQDEWQEGQPITARFQNDVRRRFIAREGLTPAEFNRLPPPRQAWAIIHRGTPEMKADVLLSDPPVMLQFRKVQRTLVSACAACHTESKPVGGFGLQAPADNEAGFYTNFIILQKYGHKEGDRKYSMIDRERPEDSLLTQFALPPELADAPHPKAGNYKGVVRMRNDPRLKAALEWIGSLSPIAPDYSDIELAPARPATAPSSRPSGRVPPSRGQRPPSE
jgi:hypothetical protein